MPRNKEPIVRVVGRFAFTGQIAVGQFVDSLVLNDTVTAQLLSLSDMYGLYRFVHLKVVLPAGVQTNSATAPGLYGVGFTPEVLLSIPTAFIDVLQVPFWCGHQLHITTGSNVLINGTTDHQSFTVPRKDLLKVGPKWFRTQGRGSESDWESQGTFLFGTIVAPATTALTMRGWCEYEVEFTDQLPLAATREKLLKQAADVALGRLTRQLTISERGDPPLQEGGPAKGTRLA